MSAESYADTHGLNANTLRHWSWRLKKEAEEAPDFVSGAEARIEFAPVRRMGPVDAAPAVAPIVVAVGGARIEISDTFDAAALERVLEVLERRRGAR